MFSNASNFELVSVDAKTFVIIFGLPSDVGLQTGSSGFLLGNGKEPGNQVEIAALDL